MKLTARLFQMLAPGRHLLVANFAPNLHNFARIILWCFA